MVGLTRDVPRFLQPFRTPLNLMITGGLSEIYFSRQLPMRQLNGGADKLVANPPDKVVRIMRRM